MTEQTQQPDEQPDEKPAHRLSIKAKLFFTLAAIGVIVFIIKSQGSLKAPNGWVNNDLPKAAELARTEGRNLLVLFVESPPSDLDRRLRNTTLAKSDNLKAVQDHNLVAVMVRVGRKNRKEVFEVYNLTRDALPAMILFDPEGNELGRNEGFIGEVAFRATFLAEALD